MKSVGPRLRTALARRVSLEGRWTLWEPPYLYIHQERERAILRLLARNGLRSLRDTRLLEVGCGSGGVLSEFIRFGARPSSAVGVDIDDGRISDARERFPHLDFQVANGSSLPFPDRAFDLVLTFTLFTSIAEPAQRAAVAREVRRVLAPGGAVLWYDFWINPVNPKTQPLGLAEIRRLFGRDPVDARRVTLAPPLAHLASRSWVACDLLSQIPLLRTHWLALVRA